MNQATLSVIKVNDQELRYVLQRTQAMRPVVLSASTVLRSESRQQMHRALQDFAECVVGHHADEPKFGEIGQVLYGMLLPETIRAELRTLQEPLVILTDDPTLPWEVLHDGKEFVALRLPLARQLTVPARIAGLLRSPEPAPQQFSALVIADPLSDLPGARAEGEALAELLRSRGECDLVVGGEATWEALTRGLVRRPYSVIHYCGHMEYDPGQRLSSIPLRDNSRLSADQIATNFRGRPLVFLNACSSDAHGVASTPSTLARTENFVEAFMFGNENGVAAAVVGTMWRVPDEPREAGRELAGAFYGALFDGRPVGEALRVSRALARERRWGPMVWGPYALYGDPNLAPFAPPGPPPPGPTVTRDIRAAKAAGPPVPPGPPSSSSSSAAPPRTEEGSKAPAPPGLPGIATDPNPLDDSGRKVFRSALREMSALGHKAMSSVHLLIGLCEAGLPAFDEALEDADLDKSCVGNRARRRAKKLPTEASSAEGISVTVFKALEFAVRRAARLGRERMTGEDLLAGLLSGPKCEAISVLKSFGVSPEQILARMPTPPEPVFAEWRFDAQALKAVQAAVQHARLARLGFLGTPHLLAGLLRAEGGRSAPAFRRAGVDPEQVCRELAKVVGEGQPGESTAHLPLKLRSRCRDALQVARGLAGGVGEIGEGHLLRAVVQETSGPTADVLRALQADPARVLEAFQAPEAPGGASAAGAG